ncbi:DUF4062 domain-containing protein [Alkalispirochaeta alkalica]|uniref:DUF4062 domain-containing protein n=1 Tax=Alkalispirochaeta alkalica TaxID=46356 RepID=UPI00039FE666|nr:DUF4062 domain-containing protein [Alkalispirochaeta alkalica]
MANIVKKYQVFISSTYIDLKDEREAAVEAILKAGHIPAGMELFKAGEEQLTTIKKWIDESDIYVLILGKRYGSIDSKTELSYTEIEYRYAIDKGMPVFAIIMSEDNAVEKIESGMNKEDIYEQNNKRKFDIFYKYVKTKIVSFANNVAEVKLAIHENIHEFKDKYELAGWARGNNFLDYEKIIELQETTKKNQKLLIENKKLKAELENRYNENLVDLGESFIVKGSYSWGDSRKGEIKHEISWEKLFGLLAPLLVECPSEKSVKKKLATYILKEEGKSGYYESIDEQNLFTIRTQLEAYDLIQAQFLNTTGGSKAMFWSLTKRGKRHMVELRAIKNDTTRDA